MTGDWVYTRSFAGKHGSRDAAMRALEAAGQQQATGMDAPGMTHMWLNLTDGAFWKHAKSCAKPHPKTAATCPQVRLRKAVARATHRTRSSIVQHTSSEVSYAARTAGLHLVGRRRGQPLAARFHP
eukprot:COSAG06_NODE_1234_length_10140_cov_36.102579_5_plen_126_part_00